MLLSMTCKPGVSAIDYKGQQYRCIAVEPYTRLDGTSSGVAVWEALCADCLQPFHTKTRIKFLKFEPNRRCAKHTRRGARVTKLQTKKLAAAEQLRQIGL